MQLKCYLQTTPPHVLTAVALTPHLLSSAFLSQQLKVLLHFLQVVKLRIDVRSLLRDSQLSADLFFISAFIIYRPPL